MSHNDYFILVKDEPFNTEFVPHDEELGYANSSYRNGVHFITGSLGELSSQILANIATYQRTLSNYVRVSVDLKSHLKSLTKVAQGILLNWAIANTILKNTGEKTPSNLGGIKHGDILNYQWVNILNLIGGTWQFLEFILDKFEDDQDLGEELELWKDIHKPEVLDKYVKLINF